VAVLAKPGKTHRKPESAAETLDQMESLGDRVGNWIAANAMMIMGAALMILVTAGGYGFVSSSRDGAREEASAALASVEGAYLQAMGGTLDSIAIDEPANPETGRRVREEYVARFEEVASEYPGTIEAQLAALEQGALQQAVGRNDDALATWQSALDASSEHASVRGLLFERIAGAQETAGRWADAAAAHEAASQIEGFPLRYLALVEAARCFVEAGNDARALELWTRLEAEAPEHEAPPHIAARMTELRAASN
jgi:predicted negative regulator of RcsB-dependent stress response